MITELSHYPAMKPVDDDDDTVYINTNNKYWWEDEAYDLYGPYHSEHECRLDQLCYVYVYL